MFVISKLFWMLAQPLSLACFAVLAASLAQFLRLRRAGLVLSLAAGIILFVVLFTTAGSYALQGLEARFPRPQKGPDTLSCMIVLGGAFETEVTTSRGGIDLNQAADRFVEALRLAMLYPQAKILVSGGDGSLSGAYEGDAAAALRFFSAFGIPAERLMAEKQSRTTFENAAFSRDVLKANGLGDCLLVTSAFHMPRSVGLFRKAGIDVAPWPVDYRTSGKLGLALDFTQPTLNAQQTSTAVREWVGLVAYYMAGRIDSLYPAP